MRCPTLVLAAGLAVGIVTAAPVPAQETGAGGDCPNAIAAFVERLRASGRWPAIETTFPEMEDRLVAALGAPAARCRATLRRERERIASAGFTLPDETRIPGESEGETATTTAAATASSDETGGAGAATGTEEDGDRAAAGADAGPAPAADDDARMADAGPSRADGGADDGIAPGGAVPEALQAPAPADPAMRAPGPEDVPLPEDTEREPAPAARNGADAPDGAAATAGPQGAATADAAATALRPAPDPEAAPDPEGAEPRDPVWTAPRPRPAESTDGPAGPQAVAPVAVREVAFGFDSARVPPSARRDVLAEVVEIARGRPEATVLLTGYASPAGDAAYNRRLSRERVAAVADALTAMGLPAERIRGRAFGEGTPRAGSDAARRMPASRRVEIRILAPRAG